MTSCLRCVCGKCKHPAAHICRSRSKFIVYIYLVLKNDGWRGTAFIVIRVHQVGDVANFSQLSFSISRIRIKFNNYISCSRYTLTHAFRAPTLNCINAIRNLCTLHAARRWLLLHAQINLFIDFGGNGALLRRGMATIAVTVVVLHGTGPCNSIL